VNPKENTAAIMFHAKTQSFRKGAKAALVFSSRLGVKPFPSFNF